MKRNMKTLAVVILGTMILAIIKLCPAQDLPKPIGYVNDFAQVLPKEEAGKLNAELIAFEKKTSIEISVATVSSLGGRDVADYAERLATEWGVGKRYQNNGVLFLIAPTERKMRIQTASGSRAILTDSRADEIRDTNVLPRFRSGDMAFGIIDGTHAIMRVLDPQVKAAETAKPAEAPMVPAEQPRVAPVAEEQHQWTADNTKVLVFVLMFIAMVAVMAFIANATARRASIKKFVLDHVRLLPDKLAETERDAKRPEIKEAIRRKLSKLRQDFARIQRLVSNDTEVNWIVMQEQISLLEESLGELASEIDQDIRLAATARREGPALMRKMPKLIAAAEEKIAKNKTSRVARSYLADARAQYAEAQAQQSGMTTTDWVVLYLLLSNAQSNISQAESAHESNLSQAESANGYVSTDHSSSYSSSSDSSSSSNDSDSISFGDSGGFGGGGGFDSGGGSSGSW